MNKSDEYRVNLTKSAAPTRYAQMKKEQNRLKENYEILSNVSYIKFFLETTSSTLDDMIRGVEGFDDAKRRSTLDFTSAIREDAMELVSKLLSRKVGGASNAALNEKGMTK